MYKIKIEKLLIVSFATLLVLAFSVTSVFAEYLGGKWGKYPVYWAINTEVASAYTTPLKDGAKNWNGRANIALRYYPDWIQYETNASVDVRVKYEPNDSYWAAKGYYAFGEPGPDAFSGTYTSGTLSIVKSKCDPLSSQDKMRVVTHEFGHLLGLAHTEKLFTSSIMDESDVWGLDAPTTYDQEQLQGLYPY